MGMVILHECTLLCINNLNQNKQMQKKIKLNKLNKWKLQEKNLKLKNKKFDY
jgi:hypothetical protein